MRRSYDIHSLQQVSSMNTEHFELCHGCREVILPVHNIVDIGPLYHRKCFRCKQCHNLLPRKGRYKYIEKDTLEYAFCRHHAPWDVDTSMLSSKSNLQSTYSQSQISFWSLNSQDLPHGARRYDTDSLYSENENAKRRIVEDLYINRKFASDRGKENLPNRNSGLSRSYDNLPRDEEEMAWEDVLTPSEKGVFPKEGSPRGRQRDKNGGKRGKTQNGYEPDYDDIQEYRSEPRRREGEGQGRQTGRRAQSLPRTGVKERARLTPAEESDERFQPKDPHKLRKGVENLFLEKMVAKDDESPRKGSPQRGRRAMREGGQDKDGRTGTGRVMNGQDQQRGSQSSQRYQDEDPYVEIDHEPGMRRYRDEPHKGEGEKSRLSSSGSREPQAKNLSSEGRQLDSEGQYDDYEHEPGRERNNDQRSSTSSGHVPQTGLQDSSTPRGSGLSKQDATGAASGLTRAHESKTPTPKVQEMNELGQPILGYDDQGYAIIGWTEHGQPFYGYDDHGQPILGYSEEGDAVVIPIEGFDENGHSVLGYTEDGVPIYAYDHNGHPILGFNENGFPVVGYAESGDPILGYDEQGHGIFGYDIYGDPIIGYTDKGEPVTWFDNNGEPIIGSLSHSGTGMESDVFQTTGYDADAELTQAQEKIKVDAHGYPLDESKHPIYAKPNKRKPSGETNDQIQDIAYEQIKKEQEAQQARRQLDLDRPYTPDSDAGPAPEVPAKRLLAEEHGELGSDIDDDMLRANMDAVKGDHDYTGKDKGRPGQRLGMGDHGTPAAVTTHRGQGLDHTVTEFPAHHEKDPESGSWSGQGQLTAEQEAAQALFLEQLRQSQVGDGSVRLRHHPHHVAGDSIEEGYVSRSGRRYPSGIDPDLAEMIENHFDNENLDDQSRQVLYEALMQKLLSGDGEPTVLFEKEVPRRQTEQATIVSTAAGDRGKTSNQKMETSIDDDLQEFEEEPGARRLRQLQKPSKNWHGAVEEPLDKHGFARHSQEDESNLQAMFLDQLTKDQPKRGTHEREGKVDEDLSGKSVGKKSRLSGKVRFLESGAKVTHGDEEEYYPEELDESTELESAEVSMEHAEESFEEKPFRRASVENEPVQKRSQRVFDEKQAASSPGKDIAERTKEKNQKLRQMFFEQQEQNQDQDQDEIEPTSDTQAVTESSSKPSRIPQRGRIRAKVRAGSKETNIDDEMEDLTQETDELAEPFEVEQTTEAVSGRPRDLKRPIDRGHLTAGDSDSGAQSDDQNIESMYLDQLRRNGKGVGPKPGNRQVAKTIASGQGRESDIDEEYENNLEHAGENKGRKGLISEMETFDEEPRARRTPIQKEPGNEEGDVDVSEMPEDDQALQQSRSRGGSTGSVKGRKRCACLNDQGQPVEDTEQQKKTLGKKKLQGGDVNIGAMFLDQMKKDQQSSPSKKTAASPRDKNTTPSRIPRRIGSGSALPVDEMKETEIDSEIQNLEDQIKKYQKGVGKVPKATAEVTESESDFDFDQEAEAGYGEDHVARVSGDIEKGKDVQKTSKKDETVDVKGVSVKKGHVSDLQSMFLEQIKQQEHTPPSQRRALVEGDVERENKAKSRISAARDRFFTGSNVDQEPNEGLEVDELEDEPQRRRPLIKADHSGKSHGMMHEDVETVQLHSPTRVHVPGADRAVYDVGGQPRTVQESELEQSPRGQLTDQSVTSTTRVTVVTHQPEVAVEDEDDINEDVEQFSSTHGVRITTRGTHVTEIHKAGTYTTETHQSGQYITGETDIDMEYEKFQASRRYETSQQKTEVTRKVVSRGGIETNVDDIYPDDDSEFTQFTHEPRRRGQRPTSLSTPAGTDLDSVIRSQQETMVISGMDVDEQSVQLRDMKPGENGSLKRAKRISSSTWEGKDVSPEGQVPKATVVTLDYGTSAGGIPVLLKDYESEKAHKSGSKGNEPYESSTLTFRKEPGTYDETYRPGSQSEQDQDQSTSEWDTSGGTPKTYDREVYNRVRQNVGRAYNIRKRSSLRSLEGLDDEESQDTFELSTSQEMTSPADQKQRKRVVAKVTGSKESDTAADLMSRNESEIQTLTEVSRLSSDTSPARGRKTSAKKDSQRTIVVTTKVEKIPVTEGDDSDERDPEQQPKAAKIKGRRVERDQHEDIFAAQKELETHQRKEEDELYRKFHATQKEEIRRLEESLKQEREKEVRGLFERFKARIKGRRHEPMPQVVPPKTRRHESETSARQSESEVFDDTASVRSSLAPSVDMAMEPKSKKDKKKLKEYKKQQEKLAKQREKEAKRLQEEEEKKKSRDKRKKKGKKSEADNDSVFESETTSIASIPQAIAEFKDAREPGPTGTSTPKLKPANAANATPATPGELEDISMEIMDDPEIQAVVNQERRKIEEFYERQRQEQTSALRETITRKEQKEIADLVDKHSKQMLMLRAQKMEFNITIKSSTSSMDEERRLPTRGRLETSHQHYESTIKPDVKPPKTKKVQFLDKVTVEIFDRLDEYVSKVAEEEPISFTDLVHELTRNCKNEMEKARAIFRWVTIKNLNELDLEEVDPDTPLGLLRGIKLGTESYHVLFKRLLSIVGLHCEIVYGFSKGEGYRPGKPITRRFRNCWTALYVDGSWRFTNCQWGARRSTGHRRSAWEEDGLQYKYDEFYFMTDPDDHIYQHFPDDPQWQLLDTPLSMEDFVKLPLVKSPFFNNELRFGGQYRSVLTTQDGCVNVKLTAPPLGAKLEARLESYYGSAKLSGEATVHTSGSNVNINASVPLPGICFLHIFANQDSACSFQVQALGVADSYSYMLPDEAFFGLMTSAEQFKISAISQTEPYVVNNTGADIEIGIVVGKRCRLAHTLTFFDEETPMPQKLDRYVLQQSHGERFEGFQVRTPKAGFSILEIFAARDEDQSEFDCVYRVLIECSIPSTERSPFPIPFNHWSKARLHYPVTSDLDVGTLVAFKLEVAHATKVAVVVGNEWHHLTRLDDDDIVWEASVYTGDHDGKLKVYAKYGTKHLPILEYRVKSHFYNR